MMAYSVANPGGKPDVKYLNWLPEVVKMESGMKYVVCHNHPEGLVISETIKGYWFEKFADRLLGVEQSSLYSLQKDLVGKYHERPLTLVLVRMADRYGVAAEIGVDVVPAERCGEVWTILETGAVPVYQTVADLSNVDPTIRTSPETPASHPERRDPTWLEQAASCQPQSAPSPSAGES